MKRILGLDLGTTSIGWALVDEADPEKPNERSSIIKTGVRIIPLTADEEDDFQKGKSTSINADRRIKRGMRRNRQRYQLRRGTLIELLKEHGIISDETVLAESGKDTTHSLLGLRTKAASERIDLEDFARVLLAINKKRGYKSNRKAKDEEDGQAIDGMEVAVQLFEQNRTPGQLVLERLKDGKKLIPDFYRSDLQSEFDKIWNAQRTFYPAILTDKLKEELEGKNIKQTWAICKEPFGIQGIKRTGKKEEQKLENYRWRNDGLEQQLDPEHLAIVLQEINGQISSSSGYLGAISDRSKELYFNKQTVGQYLYGRLEKDPHIRLKNQVFYRQDYLDEFEKIWKTQAQYHKKLTPELKAEIRDTIIFYQRRLKSQKGLIGICELEGREVEIVVDGKKKKKIIGPKVCPKSSPLFQEFKIWQKLNDLEFRNTETKEKCAISFFDEDLELRNLLFEELNVKGNISEATILKEARLNKKEGWEINFKKGIDGNKTNESLYKAYAKILELSGHELNFKMPAQQIKEAVRKVLTMLGINTEILDFNAELDGKAFEQQPAYQLWHLLYSYEGDDSKTGNEKLYEKLESKFGFAKEYAKPLAHIVLKDDYGSLSTKAMRKIIPYLKAGHGYSEAAAQAGYDHSHSETKEERENKILEDKLELLPKNSLRNPVVEKILNQMVNVVNAIMDTYGKPDEVRIELARELKKSAEERKEMTTAINNANKKHDEIRKEIGSLYPFNTGVRITRNDIIKYKLYEELEGNGYKTLYTDTYVCREELFSKEFDVEHIIPKAKLFDDSFSNKTLSTRDFNLFKGDKTGIDAVAEKYKEESEEYDNYLARIKKLYEIGQKKQNGQKGISKAKYNKLQMKESEIPDGFIERDLRNTQYIAKKSREMLASVVRTVLPTTGGVTDRLRKDWQLINVLQELNWEKYKKLGLTYYEKNKHENQIPKIKDWTKRNDHRHHVMDAIIVAFTKRSHIQYLNNLNARNDKSRSIYGIEQNETYTTIDKNGDKKRLIKPPIPLDDFRAEARRHLENILVSFKAKNKIVTKNKNKTKKKGGVNTKTEFTPRGQLHKETIYGRRYRYATKMEKVGSKFDRDKIQQVARKHYREALLKRLAKFDNDPKKAFTGKNAPAKNPVYIDEYQSDVVPEKVKSVSREAEYTIRKEVSPDLKVDKVVDIGAKRVLQKRLDEFGGDAKKAFANLEENPIWLNKEKGISIKRVTITGVSNAIPLHTKKDRFGNEVLDDSGNRIPVDYISTGNNHHVAVYRDEKGNLQENVVSFYEAVIRKNQGLPVIDKDHNADLGWQFLFTMKQNEMFVFPNEETGFNPNEIDLTDENNYHLISPNLFRVQKIATKNYVFNHHYETNAVNNDTLKNKKLKGVTYHYVRTPSGLEGIIKVRINHLGRIVKVGE